MNFSKRIYTKELLDQDDIPFPDIKKNMQELNFINNWLGGHRITVIGLKQLIGGRTKLTVCEIGCGGGDNLTAIDKAVKRKVSLKCIGIDIKQECIDFAIENPR
jgi:2-polyprenyl-3-methyl-5-hydroxy-6-metoxy-1,4-benzoquinol methylase